MDSEIKMPDAKALYNTIKHILESDADCEVKLKANGEVAIYKIKKNKVSVN